MIRREAAATSAAAALGLTAPIRRYPGWTVLDLITHTGGVHRWVTTLVGEGSQERIPRHSFAHEIPPDEAIGWFEAGVHELVSTLERVDPEQPVWTLSDDRRAAFWHRRMAHETALHRWDAQSAHDAAAAVDPDLGVSALEESLDTYVTRRLDGQDVSGAGERVLLRCTNRPVSWRITLEPSAVRVTTQAAVEEAADAEISGSASDLWLFVMGRLPLSALEAAGDPEAGRLLVRALSLMADATA